MLSTYGGFTNYANDDGARVQPRHRPRGRVDGREGHPLGLHPPSRGRPRHDGGARAWRARAPTSVTGFLAEMQRELRPARRLPGRVGVRHRRRRRRQHRPGRAGDGRGRRLPGADGVPVALGPGHVPRRQPDQRALRRSSHKSLADFQRVARGHRRAVPARGCRTSRSTACPTASTRCASRSAPRRSSGSSGFLLWNPNVEYTDEALDPLPVVLVGRTRYRAQPWVEEDVGQLGGGDLVELGVGAAVGRAVGAEAHEATAVAEATREDVLVADLGHQLGAQRLPR